MHKRVCSSLLWVLATYNELCQMFPQVNFNVLCVVKTVLRE